jgi:hypothetical protein
MKIIKFLFLTSILIFATGCATGNFEPPCACYNPQPANQKGIIYG